LRAAGTDSLEIAWPHRGGAVLKPPVMTNGRRLVSLVALLVPAMNGVACDDGKPQRNPFDPPPNAPKPAPSITETPKPQGPPELILDATGPKVGFLRVMLQKPEDYEKLKQAVEEAREHYNGKEAHIIASRDTKTQWVVTLLNDLDAIGATPIYVRTQTRKEFSGELEFLTERKAANLPSCSVVATVREDRGTAVWRLSGGTASKRSKGFAGPDLSMTADTLERYFKGCKQSDTLFVSGAEEIEWGLVYDLAASAKKLEKATFGRLVLLSEPPTAGRPVKLAH